MFLSTIVWLLNFICILASRSSTKTLFDDKIYYTKLFNDINYNYCANLMNYGNNTGLFLGKITCTQVAEDSIYKSLKY